MERKSSDRVVNIHKHEKWEVAFLAEEKEGLNAEEEKTTTC